MQEVIILLITISSSLVTIGRFVYDYRHKWHGRSCCASTSVDVIEDDEAHSEIEIDLNES